MRVAAAVAADVLTITDKKLFSVAVYPTLAYDELKIAEFNVKKTVDN